MGRASVPLASGVYRIPTMGDFINSFAFVDADGSLTLVDCGLERAPAAIVRGLASFGAHPKDVTRIVLTHAHADHAGGAHEMVEITTATGIDVHADDAGFVRDGRTPPLQRPTGAGRILQRFTAAGFTPADVSRELRDGEVLDVTGGLRVVHTPGHTPGHIALLHEATGVLITGDSIFNMGARRTWPFAAFCTSFEQSKQTAGVLADLDYSVAAFTHGPEIRDHARERIRDFLRKRHG